MRLLDRILFRLRKMFGRDYDNMTAMKGVVEDPEERYRRSAEYFAMLVQLNGWTNEAKKETSKDI